jgi:hypothetical protein
VADLTHDEPLVTRTVLSPVTAITEALLTERKLLDELIVVMQRQRNAVANDDLQAVDDSVFATHRVLVTLNEARRKRRALNALLGEREDLNVQALDEVLEKRMTPELRDARDQLQAVARALSREVAINRRLLRDALACGDVYARTLAGVEQSILYAPGANCDARRPGASSLLDRRI